jgi:hypothetical protein
MSTFRKNLVVVEVTIGILTLDGTPTTIEKLIMSGKMVISYDF